MAGDGVGVVSRGDGDVPLPEAATLSSAPLYGSTASPTRGRRSSVRARGFQFWREVEGAVPVLGRVGSTMEVEEPARTMSGGHDSVAAAAAAFSLHAVRRLDTAPAPIAATAGKNSVMAASSIDGSRGGGFPGASSSMVAWMAFCSPLHQLQLQQHGGRELSPAPVYSLHPPPSSGDAPISKPPIEPSSSRFQSQHAFAAAAAAAHRNTILWRVVQNVLPWKTKDRTSGESKSSGIMWSFAAGSNLSTSTGFNAEKESRKNLNKFYKELRTLNTVNMAGRQFGDEGLFFLAESLAYNKSAEEVDFSSNGITVVGIEAFDGILQINTALKTLNLSGNAIGDEGAKYLSDILVENVGIQKLLLNSTNIGDEGAKAISDMLKKNKTIRTLQLSNNIIEYSGFASIAEALLENNVLRSLYLKLVAHYPVAFHLMHSELAYEVVNS